MFWVWYTYYLIHLLHMKKLRHRASEKLGQRHRASMWQSQDSSSDSVAPDTMPAGLSCFRSFPASSLSSSFPTPSILWSPPNSRDLKPEIHNHQVLVVHLWGITSLTALWRIQGLRIPYNNSAIMTREWPLNCKLTLQCHKSIHSYYTIHLFLFLHSVVVSTETTECPVSSLTYSENKILECAGKQQPFFKLVPSHTPLLASSLSNFVYSTHCRKPLT